MERKDDLVGDSTLIFITPTIVVHCQPSHPNLTNLSSLSQRSEAMNVGTHMRQGRLAWKLSQISIVAGLESYTIDKSNIER